MEREVPVVMLRASADFGQSPPSLGSQPLTTPHHFITTPRRVHYPMSLMHVVLDMRLYVPAPAKFPSASEQGLITSGPKMCRSPLSFPSSLPRHPRGEPGGPPVSHPQADQAGQEPEEKLGGSVCGGDRAGWWWLAGEMRVLTFLWLFLQGPAGRRSSGSSTGPRSPLPHMATC